MKFWKYLDKKNPFFTCISGKKSLESVTDPFNLFFFKNVQSSSGVPVFTGSWVYHALSGGGGGGRPHDFLTRGGAVPPRPLPLDPPMTLIFALREFTTVI